MTTAQLAQTVNRLGIENKENAIMAKGWDGIEQQTAATAEQRQRASETFLPELKIGDKEHSRGPFMIRFGEQGPDVNNYGIHEYKVPAPNGGRPWVKRFTCLREAPYNGERCPGCEAGMRLKRRGVYNLIQRQRPVFRKDADGKALKNTDGSYIVDGYADTVVIANVGGPTAEMLRKADATYRGLMSRDFWVQWSGDTFQSWNLAPVMDDHGNAIAMPLSENDQALLAQKYDLDRYMKPPTLEEADRIVRQYGSNSGAQVGGPPAASPQGTAAQAGTAAGYAAPPAAVQQQSGSAFAAAQQAPPPPPPLAPAPQVPVQPVQVQQPGPVPAAAPQPAPTPAPAAPAGGPVPAGPTPIPQQ
jgi:hypothetical protein